MRVAAGGTSLLLGLGFGDAKIISPALLPVELAFWIGFALPLGPVLGIARTILVLLL